VETELNAMRRSLASPLHRLRDDGGAKLPFALVIGILVVFFALSRSSGEPLHSANAYDILQTFAALGPVSIGIALTMIAGEFDLSITSMYTLGGTIAVLTGQHDPALGVLCAVGVGCLAGAIQGGLVGWLGLSSVPVTLGGNLILLGIAYAATNSKSVAYDDYNVGIRLDQPIAEVLSIRSLIALSVFVVIAGALRFTRIGRDVRAVGADRRAARVAGVAVGPMLIAVFVASAVTAALSGALLGYSLAAASPNISSAPLIFAVTAAVLGGVRLTGGYGTVLGVAIGVIALAALQEGLVIVAASDYVSHIVTGSLLALVAVISAPELFRGPARGKLRIGNRAALATPPEQGNDE
jgi:ribose transport system permease protein